MIILTLRTDKPESEIGLYKDDKSLVYEKWDAHKKLAETIHKKIEEILISQSLTHGDINGIVCYLGPGSFTGLRIGVSVANALAYALDVPISGSQGEAWVLEGIAKLKVNTPVSSLVPEYGAPVFTTKPKK